MAKSILLSGVFLFMALVLSGCATSSGAPSGSTSANQGAGKGIVMVVMKDVEEGTVFVGSSRVDRDLQQFSKKIPGFITILGDVKPGILTAMLVKSSAKFKARDGKKYIGTYKNVRAGNYIFLGIYDEGKSGCFGEQTKIFDVKPGFVNLVTLPKATAYLKAGFFKSVPDTSGTNWDYAANLSDSELLIVYETTLKDYFKLDLPPRVSNVTAASFIPRSRPAVSYNCLAPDDLKYSVLPQ